MKAACSRSDRDLVRLPLMWFSALGALGSSFGISSGAGLVIGTAALVLLPPDAGSDTSAQAIHASGRG